MAERIKVINKVGDIMFEVMMPDKYIHLLTISGQKITPYIKNAKKVPIGTGNAGTSLEYEAEYDGYQVKWEDFRPLADEDADI